MSTHSLRKPGAERPLLLAAILLTAGGVAIYQGHQAARQREQVQFLRQREAFLAAQVQQLQQERTFALHRLAPLSAGPAPPLPAPQVQVATQLESSPGEGLQTTNLYARVKDAPPRLTAAQVEAYLQANGRTAPNLLAAYRTSCDTNLLAEAMQKFPEDPQVAFEAAFQSSLTPEQRCEWLNAFQKSAPDNALPDYLSALTHFKAGQTDQAIQDLLAASAKPQFNDYTLNRWQDNEEAYLAVGYSPAEAKLLGGSQLRLPQLAELKQLGLQMVETAKAYRDAGDEVSAQSVLQMTLGLGQSYNGSSAGDCAISHLVGLAIQRLALGAMNPNSPFGDSGRTVQEQLTDLTQQHNAIRSAFEQNEALLANMSDQDWLSYIDRQKSFGDEAALRWAVNKLGRK